MKKFLLILLIIFVVVIGIFSFLFYQTIDEKSYERQIISSAQELLGRQLQVKGKVSIKLFPSPVLTITDVGILNPQGFKNKDLVHIEKVEARIQFSSLFKNPLNIQNITLIKPQVFLEKNEEGKINWDFTFLRPDKRRISEDSSLGEKVSDIPPQFQNMDIKGGKVVYLNQPLKTDVSFSDIDGQLKANTIKGPFDFKGQIKVDKMPVETTLHIDVLGANVETKFNVSLSAPNSKANFSVQNGVIARFAEPTQEVSGSFSIVIPELSSFLIDWKGYKDLPLELNKKITGTGQFLFSSKQAVFDELAFVYGEVNSDISTSGRIALTYPSDAKDKRKTDVLLRFSQLNLDLLSAYMPKKSQSKEIFTILPERITDNTDFLISSEKVTLNGGQLSKMSLKGRYRDNIMSIFDFSIILPEKVQLTANGEIVTKQENPNAKIAILLNGKDLTSTFTWLKMENSFIKNPAALRDVEIKTQLEMTPDNLTFRNINTKIANGRISGDLSFSLTAPQLTAFATLNIQSLNFDSFVPYETTQKKLSLKQSLNSFKLYLEKSVLFSNADVQFNLTASDVSFKNLPIQQVMFKGQVKNSEWITEELNIKQIATADIRYSGTMRKDKKGSLVFDNVNANIDIPKASIFFDRLKIETPINSTIGKLTVNATMNGSFDEMSIAAQTTVAQGRIQLEGKIRDILSEVSPFDFQTKIVFPGLTQFVRLFQPTYRGHPNLTGSFNFDGLISGGLNSWAFKNAALTVGPQKLNFDLDITQQDTLVKAVGNISSPCFYFDKFVVDDATSSNGQYSKGLLDFSSMDNLQLDVKLTGDKASWENFETTDFSSHILLNEKILQIEDTKAKVEEGQISFNSTLNFSASTSYLKGRVEVNAVPVKPDVLSLGNLRLKEGLTTFTADFNTKGNSVDDMMRSLSGNGNFEVQKGIVSGMNLLSFERNSQAMAVRMGAPDNMAKTLQKEFFAGETVIEEFKGSYAVTSGLLRSTDTVLKSQNANILMQMDWNIPQRNFVSSAAVSFKNLAGYPPVSLSIKGNPRNLQTSLDLTSFVKYIETSAADARNEYIRKQREEEAQRKQKENASRVEQIAKMTAQAESQIELAQRTLQLAPSENAQSQLIRASDAFVVLQELSNKTSPSEADLAKASVQASQIASRTESIMNEVNNKAEKTLQEQMAKHMENAQKQMYAITRVYQRLGNVEIVNQAYKKASSSFEKMQKINTEVSSIQDINTMQNVAKQMAENADVIDLTYQSIAKYDIDAAQSGSYYEQSSTMQGTIRRN